MEEGNKLKDIFGKYPKNAMEMERGDKKQVDDLLSLKAANVLTRRIKFHKAIRKDVELDILKSKYIPLGTKSSSSSSSEIKPKESSNTNGSKTSVKPGKLEEEDLPKPTYELFPQEKLPQLLKWNQVGRIGSGLNNMGNTCFLNSVLQCLTYTPPLANYALKREHSQKCTHKGSFCMLCAMENHIINSLKGNGTVTPKMIISNLRNISPTLRFGRQEDSHEFIRYVVEAMQKICLQGLPKNIDPKIAETSVIHRIFGGYLQSQVKCSECNYKSNTFDPFLDLSLEIQGCDSLEKALQKFTRPEILDKANKYKCPKCGNLVQAQKQFTIKKAPTVLTIQLKRFKFGFGGGSGFFGGNFGSGKINKPIHFADRLNLKPYLSQNETDNPTYRLYGVLVHAGDSTRSGHYYCFVKSSSDVWHCMNDSSVRQVGLNQVMSESAYMLFYVKDNIHFSPSTSITAKKERVVKEGEETKRAEESKSNNNSNHKLENGHTKKQLNLPKIISESNGTVLGNGHANGNGNIQKKNNGSNGNIKSNGNSNGNFNGNSKMNGHPLNFFEDLGEKMKEDDFVLVQNKKKKLKRSHDGDDTTTSDSLRNSAQKMKIEVKEKDRIEEDQESNTSTPTSTPTLTTPKITKSLSSSSENVKSLKSSSDRVKTPSSTSASASSPLSSPSSLSSSTSTLRLSSDKSPKLKSSQTLTNSNDSEMSDISSPTSSPSPSFSLKNSSEKLKLNTNSLKNSSEKVKINGNSNELRNSSEKVKINGNSNELRNSSEKNKNKLKNSSEKIKLNESDNTQTQTQSQTSTQTENSNGLKLSSDKIKNKLKRSASDSAREEETNEDNNNNGNISNKNQNKNKSVISMNWDEKRETSTKSEKDQEKKNKMLKSLLLSKAISNWDDHGIKDAATEKERRDIEREIRAELDKTKLEALKRPRDEWDEELDRGKVKKIKQKKVIDESERNQFQAHSEKKQKKKDRMKFPNKLISKNKFFKKNNFKSGAKVGKKVFFKKR